MTLRKFIILTFSLFAAPLWGQITDNGSISVTWPEAHRGVFEVSGDFGGGTVYFERNLGGEYVEFEAGGYEDDSFYEFVTTASELRVRLTGASSPSVYISINGRILTDSEWTVAEDPAILSLSGVSYWVAGQETDSQNLAQQGTTTGAGDAQFGSTSGSDSNDPTALPWYATSDYDVTVDGVNYKYLSDNLVTNGTFDADTGWTKQAGWTISGGAANFTTQGSWREMHETSGTIASGRVYYVTYDVTVSAGQFQVILGSGIGTGDGTLRTSTGTYSELLVAHGSAVYFWANPTASGSIDNVVVHEVTANLGDHVYLPGTSGNYLSHPDSAAVSVTGDITIQVECAVTDLSLGGRHSLLSKFNESGGKTFSVYVSSSNINVFLSQDGSSFSSGTNKSISGLSNDTKYYFRFCYNVSTTTGAFYYSTDNSTFTQIGTDVTDFSYTALADTSELLIIGATNNGAADKTNGSFYSAHIWNSDIGDTATSSAPTPVMNWRASSMTQSGGADEESGGTWTVNRSASGLKSQLISRPQVDGATDDYLEVADNANLDVGDGVDFWVAWYGRYHGTPGGNQVLVAKKTDLTTGAGYAIYLNTSRQPVGVVGDGTNDDTITGTALGASEATLIVFQRNGSNIELIQVDAGGTVSATPVVDTTGDLSNALTLRMFRLSSTGTSYADASGFAWCQNGTGYLTAAQAASLKAELDTELAGRTGE